MDTIYIERVLRGCAMHSRERVLRGCCMDTIECIEISRGCVCYYLTPRNGSCSPCRQHGTDQTEWGSTDAHCHPPSTIGLRQICRRCGEGGGGGGRCYHQAAGLGFVAVPSLHVESPTSALLLI